MKSKGVAPGVLLDTAFILPTLGITVSGVDPGAIKLLAKSQVEIYYSSFSILESLWVASRISGAKMDVETFQLGLRSIIEGHRYKRANEDSEIFREAFNLYRIGHKDMIDNILATTAAQKGLTLITLDDDLMNFASEKKLRIPMASPDLSALKALVRK